MREGDSDYPSGCLASPMAHVADLHSVWDSGKTTAFSFIMSASPFAENSLSPIVD